jgi:hypothetical protein
VVEAALSAGALRPRLIVVWVLLLMLAGVIATIELTERSANSASDAAGSRDRMLLPVPIEQLGAIELAHAGTLHRFERDEAGNWFYHGMHSGAEAAHGHQANPAMASRIEQALAALGRARIEREMEVGARGDDYGMASPGLLILAYRPKEALPLVQYAIGDIAPDQLSRYAQAVGSHTVITVANYQIDNLLGLIQAVGGPTEQASAAKTPAAQASPAQ